MTPRLPTHPIQTAPEAAYPSSSDWPTALGILRDAGSRINQLGPDTSLREALQLIAETAVRLVSADAADCASAVIYTFNSAAGQFDPQSRVSAGEGEAPPLDDRPRAGGMGATALTRRARVLSYEEHSLRFHPLKYEGGVRTSACYPLMVGSQAVGALYIDLRRDRLFTDQELLLLDTFVHLAAVAIYNTRQFEGMNRALRRKVDELERVHEADRLISSRRNLDETLREILNTALNLTGAEFGSFRLLDKSAGLLRLRAIVGGDPTGERTSLPPDVQSGVVGWVARHRQPARIDDLRVSPWAAIYQPLTDRRLMRSELAVPLLGSGGGLEGVLNVESPYPAHFDQEAQATLEALATQATIALQEGKLLDTIEDVTERIIGYPPDEVFALLLERAGDLLNAPQSAVWQLAPDEPRHLVLRAYRGDFPPGYSVPVSGSLVGTAVLTRLPVICTDIAHDPRMTRRDLARRMDWAAALIVPLTIRDGTPRGALGVYTSEPRSFSDWDTRLLSVLGNHAAVTLQLAEALNQAKLAEERQAMAETFAVLGDVSANLLHRVNNLIGIIPVKVQGITDKRPAVVADRYVADSLRDIEAGARAAMDVARETVTYLRPVTLKPTSVAHCYATATARLALPRQVALSSQGLEPLPPVLAGEEQLRLVLFNLIENAVDALGEAPGAISVTGKVVPDSLERSRAWVELSVADDGPGVAPENRERIFEPNYSTKHSIKKLGFGLWWVKSWVQRCGGSITLAPQTAGSTFVIRLPLAGT
jgi:GAF domain-containing protein